MKNVKREGPNLKRLMLSTCLAVLLSLNLFACVPPGGSDADTTAATVESGTGIVTTKDESSAPTATESQSRSSKAEMTIAPSGQGMKFRSAIIRTPALGSNVGVGEKALIIRNAENFNDYLRRHTRGWQFSDEDLRSLKSDYDDAFFRDNILICGVFASNSGSTILKATHVDQTEGKIQISFSIEMPDKGTTDMMSWHYFVELEAAGTEGSTVETNLPAQEAEVEYE
ncbi:MAG: hypothetical protein GX671_04925 [Clostridiales bacterium]|nr:hypothetical protein [Clostridiales bacterium]